MPKKGGTEKLRYDIAKVVRRLKTSRDTLQQIRGEYHISHITLRRELLAAIPEAEYIRITRVKLAQGNEPQRWTSAWGIRGMAARKWRPVGTISIKIRNRKYGPLQEFTSVRKEQYIKIQDYGTKEQCWMRLAVYIWIKENGQVPEGFFVVFKNGNSMDCRPENLTLANKKTQIALTKLNCPGMSYRGAISAHVQRRLGINIPHHKFRSGIVRRFDCVDCGQEYKVKPERCEKCGKSAFEEVRVP